jgi:deoxyribodipyrimidine photo-lyase
MANGPVIVWLRQDLRLTDHPALSAAVDSGRAVLPVYVLDDETPGEWRFGGASRWWLHQSLAGLAADLEKRGARLVLRRGRFVETLMALAQETDASAIHFTRGYEPYIVETEKQLKSVADAKAIAVRRFSGALLYEPEAIRTREEQPFKVFTPFWKACLAVLPPADPLPAPRKLVAPKSWPKTDDLSAWGLLPTWPDWAGGLRETWQPGEAGAQKRLDDFLAHAVAGYADDRDRPDKPGTSLLSAPLHFGDISPRQCWHAARAAEAKSPRLARGVASFLRELGWREFSTHLLFHFPQIPHAPFRPEFARFPWRDAGNYADDLKRWQKGQTGFPIVDAGMRQLWHTGIMHNRVRMIVASLLTKHLRIPWQEGAAWFWDTLVDADLANNSASWQWVAGSGADAAPYFRIFNPMLQGAKFDPDGDYVRRWVPELAKLSAAYIQAPWEAPADVLAAAGVRIGETYPAPIVDHGKARAAALAAYEAVKG